MRATLSGIPDLKASLRDLSKSQTKSAVRVAMIDAAADIADSAASKAPVDQGALGDSLVRTARIIRSQAKDSRRPEKEEVRVFVGPNYARSEAGSKGYAPHAHLVEFGTGPRWHESGKYVGQMPAKPFMRPAFDAEVKPYIRKIGEALLLSIEQAVERARTKRGRAKRGKR